MLPNRTMSWLVIALLLALAAPANSADPKLFQIASDKAIEASSKRKWAEADALFVEALIYARGDRQLESKAALAGALNLERWLNAKPAEVDEAQRKRMIQWYELTRDQGAEQQQTLACNNLGVYYLKQNDLPRSIATFRRMENSPQANAVYNFNFGRALEANKQPKFALQQYGKALAKDPNFARAADVAQQLIAALDAKVRVLAARDLLDVPLPAKPDPPAPGAPPRAVSQAIGRLVYLLLDKLQADPDSDALASYVLRYLARSRADAQRFASVDWPALKAIKSNERLVTPLKGIYGLFNEPVTNGKAVVVMPYDNIFDRFPRCREFDRSDRGDRPTARRDLARLLKAAGDGFAARAAQAERPDLDAAREALLRYTAAFALDHQYPDAALQAVQIFVGDVGAQIDPEHRLLDPFAQAVFEEKSTLFAMASTKEELRALSLFHVTLATIYEKRPGPPGTAQTAVFQWDHALRAENRIRNDLDPSYPASPVLRQRLASAYLADGKPNDAWKYGSEAMQLMVDTGQLNTARQYHRELTAPNSPWKLTDDKRAHLTAVVDGTTNTNRLRPLPDVAGPLPFTVLGMHTDESKRLVLFAAVPGPKGGITRAIWAPKGDLVEVKHFPLSEQAILCTHNGGHYLYTGNAALDAWAPRGWNTNRITDKVGRAAQLDIADDGNLTISRTGKGEFGAWDGKLPRVLFERKLPGGALTLSADGKHLALAGDMGLELVDARTGKILHGPDKEAGRVRSLCFSTDGKWLATVASAGTVELRDPATGKLQKSLTAHTPPVDSMVFSPTRPWLVTLSMADSSVRIWDVNRGQVMVSMPRNGKPLAAAFSPDGNWLSVSYQSGNSGLVKTWDVAKLMRP